MRTCVNQPSMVYFIVHCVTHPYPISTLHKKCTFTEEMLNDKLHILGSATKPYHMMENLKIFAGDTILPSIIMLVLMSTLNI